MFELKMYEMKKKIIWFMSFIHTLHYFHGLKCFIDSFVNVAVKQPVKLLLKIVSFHLCDLI